MLRFSVIYNTETVLENDVPYVPTCVCIMLPGDDGLLAS